MGGSPYARRKIHASIMFPCCLILLDVEFSDDMSKLDIAICEGLVLASPRGCPASVDRMRQAAMERDASSRPVRLVESTVLYLH